ncbi:MAG: hypothetical protein DYG96_06340 [Chlorobi bacterium CHB2]|nr:hypothetical protein [Chlorobi bacterium CHB2]
MMNNPALPKTTVRLLLAALAVALAAGVVGCGDNGVITDPLDIVFPESNVSYSQHVQPLFDLSCTSSGCHDGYTQAGGLRLETYADLFQKPGMVRPNDSTRSTLRLAIRGVTVLHPRIEPPLTENQARGIAIWIQEGASNN